MGVVGNNKMEVEYKIKIGTDETQCPASTLSYEAKRSESTNDRPKTDQDRKVVRACFGLRELLGSEEIEVTIKSK